MNVYYWPAHLDRSYICKSTPGRLYEWHETTAMWVRFTVGARVRTPGASHYIVPDTLMLLAGLEL